MNQYVNYHQTQSAKKNECGGILAFVGKKDQGGALEFTMKNAHYLQKLPYYQCGVTLLNNKSQSM